ncbi:MAG: hypothetical protein RLZZ500_1665 [Bacteroidota bacterium]|jgi:hypothetical protein
MKRILLFFLVFTVGYAQNQPKIIIPEQFTFMREPNLYGLGTLLQMYMEKYHYTSEMKVGVKEEAFPKALHCDEWGVKLLTKSNMFVTKVTVQFMDCHGTIIASSPEGSDRDKNTRMAYINALRNAMDQFTAFKNQTLVMAQNEVTTKPVKVQEPLSTEVVVETTAMVTENDVFLQARTISDVSIGLYRNNGTSPAFVLYKTSSRDCFLVEIQGKMNGVLLYQNQKWYWEYYDNNRLISNEQFIKGL